MNNGTFSGLSTAPALSSLGSSVQFFEFLSSGVWQKPQNCSRIRILLIGGGGGGARPQDGVPRAAGAGGVGGNIISFEMDANLIAQQVTVFVGAGGQGGKASTTDGSGGGFSALLYSPAILSGQVRTGLTGFHASGGNGGPRSTTGASASRTESSLYQRRQVNSGGGGQSTGANGSNASTITVDLTWGCGSGGGGGGASATASGNGGNGSALTATYYNLPSTGALGGTAIGNLNGEDGLTIDTAVTRMLEIGMGGGGGAANHLGTAGNGGNGSFPGGGGGGGGAGLTSGNGGDGANGIVRIWTW